MVFKSYGTVEEMFADIEMNRKAADARINSQQSEIKPGDYFATDDGDDLVIIGEVLEPDHGSKGREAQYQRKLYAQPHMRGFRFTRCYSVMCTTGEYGDTHISRMTKISREEFQKLLSEIQG